MYSETIEHNTFTIKLMQDEDCSNPRENSQISMFLGFKHRNYTIGDEQIDPHEAQRNCPGCKGEGQFTFPIMGEDVTRDCPVCGGEGALYVRSFEDMVAYVREEYDATGPVLPVGMIDHSNVHYYVGRHVDQWDGSHAGLIFYTNKGLIESGWDTRPTDEQMIEWLTAEVNEYDKWASGDCWGYTITDRNGDETDSCWGFIGHEYAIESAKEACPEPAEQPAPLFTLRLTDRTIDTVLAALSALTYGSAETDKERVLIAEADRALEVVRGARAGGNPESQSQYADAYRLIAPADHPNAGKTFAMNLNPAELRTLTEMGWTKA